MAIKSMKDAAYDLERFLELRPARERAVPFADLDTFGRHLIFEIDILPSFDEHLWAFFVCDADIVPAFVVFKIGIMFGFIGFN